jgi:uncharacterized protein (DUF2237 family)
MVIHGVFVLIEWLEAYQNHKAPYVKLKSTNIKALEKIDLDSPKRICSRHFLTLSLSKRIIDV